MFAFHTFWTSEYELFPLVIVQNLKIKLSCHLILGVFVEIVLFVVIVLIFDIVYKACVTFTNTLINQDILNKNASTFTVT